MPKFLIDASVFHGYANTKDKHHSICKNFFDAHENETLYFSIHSLFEVQASRSRRIIGRDFLGLPGNRKLRNHKFIDINRKFYDECQRIKLFDVFKSLKGSDLIYACLAKIGGFTLVTCDKDFDPYRNEISILRLI